MVVHGLLLSVQLAFASLPVAGKIVMRTLSPNGLALARIAGAATFFLIAYAMRRPLRRVPWRDVVRIAALSLVGVAGNQLLFLTGLSNTTAINASVLISTIPVFAVAIAVLLRRERARVALLAGVALSFCGVLSLIGAEAFSTNAATMIGDLLIAANALLYASYLVLVRGVLERHGPTVVIALAFAFGTLFTIPFGAAELARGLPALTPSAWAVLAFIVLVPTIFTYFANAWALRHARASLVAIYTTTQPVATAVMAVVWLGEALTPRVFAAAVLIVLGIVLVARPDPRRVAAARLR